MTCNACDATVGDMSEILWEGCLAPLGVISDDGLERILDADSKAWTLRSPAPLLDMQQNVVGRVDSLDVVGSNLHIKGAVYDQAIGDRMFSGALHPAAEFVVTDSVEGEWRLVGGILVAVAASPMPAWSGDKVWFRPRVA